MSSKKERAPVPIASLQDLPPDMARAMKALLYIKKESGRMRARAARKRALKNLTGIVTKRRTAIAVRWTKNLIER
jgi:hypothetical protein